MERDMVMGDYFNVYLYYIFYVITSIYSKEDGSRTWHTIVAVSYYCTVLTICFGFMIYASANIASCLQNSKLISKMALSMQKQMFFTLSAQVISWISSLSCFLIQTLIPFILLYCPCGIIIVFPFFGLNAEFVADISPLLLSLFLPLDAIAVLYIMKDYRRAVIQFLRCRRCLMWCIHLAACIPGQVPLSVSQMPITPTLRTLRILSANQLYRNLSHETSRCFLSDGIKCSQNDDCFERMVGN